MNWLARLCSSSAWAPGWRQALCIAILVGGFVLVEREDGQALAVNEEPTPRGTFSGVVQNANGAPIVGASVVVSRSHSAHEKLLDGVYSHPDCLKHAVTDSHGEFAIDGIDAGRRLTLMIAADGHATKSVSDVDAQDGRREIVLSGPRLKTITRSINDVYGRVVDPEGDPVGGAIVAPRGYMQGDIGLEGPMESVAQITVTNADGEFRVPSALAVSALHLQVSARGFVPQFLAEVSNGGDEQTLTLKRGATLRGRVVLDGVPQRGIVVGANVAQRFSGSWNGPWGTLTDQEGRFTIAHVVPDKQLCVFAAMESVGGLGAAPQAFVTAADETNIDLGDLPITSGFRLHGRVVLADDASLPDNLHLSIVRNGSGERILTPVDENGEFEVHNLPAEILHISAYGLIEGSERRVWPWPFHLSAENASLDPHNPHHLVGLLSENTEITILLAPGKFEFPPPPTTAEESTRIQAALQRLRRSPLKGIDAEREH